VRTLEIANGSPKAAGEPSSAAPSLLAHGFVAVP